MQNDDWVYYWQIGHFLAGHFDIHNYIEATFYTQGILGLIFSKLFGLEKLPILTLLMAVLNFFLFTHILNRFYLKKVFDSILIGLLFFISPLHAYASIGFMTDIYFLFFILLTFVFVEYYIETDKTLYFALANIAGLAGFFSRQLSVISLIALLFFLLYKKKYTYAAIEFAGVATLLIYYFFFYPLTSLMQQNHGFRFLNIFDFKYMYTSIFISIFYAVVFIIPLLIAIFYNYISKNLNKIWLVLALTVGIFGASLVFFSADLLRHDNMFYMHGVLVRNGFFYGTSLGTKYQIKYEDQIYNVWDIVSKVAVALTITLLILHYKKLLNYFTIYISLYIGVLSIMLITYDRYTLAFTPVAIIIFFEIFKDFKFSTVSRIIVIVGLLVTLLYSYNFTMEFITLNRYLWTRANSIYAKGGTQKNKISAGYAWRRNFPNSTGTYRYLFYFQPYYTLPENLACCYSIKETYNIKFPLSIFDDAKIYMYKKTF